MKKLYLVALLVCSSIVGFGIGYSLGVHISVPLKYVLLGGMGGVCVSIFLVVVGLLIVAFGRKSTQTELPPDGPLVA